MAAEQTTTLQREGGEQPINVQREPINIIKGGGAVNSVNGQTGDVVLTATDVGALPDTTVIPTKTSELTNDSGFATETYVTNAVGGETQARVEADNGLQNQIDALSAASNVTDIVGTYAELEAYDTSKLNDNDIIKVLQDETHDDETTYYRWVKATSSFSLIGEEGPYYTKSAADQKFQDKLTAGSNITIDADNEISATDTTYSNFTGTDGVDPGTAGLVPAPATTDAGKYLKADGTWDTVSAGPTVVQTTGTSQTDVMSQVATSQMIYPSGYETSKTRIRIGSNSVANANNSVAIGSYANATGDGAIALGGASISERANATNTGNIAIGPGAQAGTAFSETAIGRKAIVSQKGSVALGGYSRTSRESEVSIGDPSASDTSYQYRYLANVKDPQYAQDAATKNYTDSFYPVGAVYTSTSSTAPTFAGGTWTNIGSQTIGGSTVYYYERTA